MPVEAFYTGNVTPIRGVARRLEHVINEEMISKIGAEEITECIDDLMILAKRYEPVDDDEDNLFNP